MNAKKLMVGSVIAVTLTLFTGAMYAQQLAVPQEDTTEPPIARQEEGVPPEAQAALVSIGANDAVQIRHSDHRSAETPGLDRAPQPTRLRYRYVNASAVEERESSFGRWSREAHQAGGRDPRHDAGSHR